VRVGGRHEFEVPASSTLTGYGADDETMGIEAVMGPGDLIECGKI